VEHNFGIREGALNFADSRAASDPAGFYDFTLAPRRVSYHQGAERRGVLSAR
jgi:hypothetical protein